VFFLCACGDEGPTSTVVKKQIGPEGGTVLGPKGTKLFFPRDAERPLIEVKVSEVPSEEIAPVLCISNKGCSPEEFKNYERLSLALYVEPDDLVFKKPVTIELPYVPGSIAIEQQESQVQTFQTSLFFTGTWDALGGTAETNRHINSAETTRLGVFSVFLAFPKSPEVQDTPLAKTWIPWGIWEQESPCNGITKIETISDNELAVCTIRASNGNTHVAEFTNIQCKVLPYAIGEKLGNEFPLLDLGEMWVDLEQDVPIDETPSPVQREECLLVLDSQSLPGVFVLTCGNEVCRFAASQF